MTRNDKLSRAASEIRKLSNSHAEAADYDAGEWSGPAHANAEEREQNVIAHKYGYSDFDALYKAIAERTTEKFAFFNLL